MNCAFFEPRLLLEPRPLSAEVEIGDFTPWLRFMTSPFVRYTKTTDQRLLNHPLFDEVLDKYEIALI
jgi:hypothetical protein